VTVRVTNADENIRPGMTALVKIIIDQVDNALLVPNKAIRTSSGQKTVTVLSEGRQITIPVTVGLVGDSLSEISSDRLQEGDVVVLHGSTSSSDQTGNATGGPQRIEVIEGEPVPMEKP
jgi:multidrug efflux pump subunit AcrA (membrane-fusion protein)